MQLKKIQAAIAEYEVYLSTTAATKNLFWWESQQVYQREWNLAAYDLAAMYARSLENRQTRRIWHRENYAPKQMMERFWQAQPDFVKPMFEDLYNEAKGLEGRASRFVFYCDQLLEFYREQHPLSKEDSHYHNDGYQMLSWYLAFQYPERYAPYHFAAFRSILEQFGAPELPATHDLERYAKVCRTLSGLLQKNARLIANHQQRLDPDWHYAGESLLLVYDFIDFLTPNLIKA